MLRLVSLFSFKKKKNPWIWKTWAPCGQRCELSSQSCRHGSSTELNGLGFRLYLGILLSSAKLKIFGCVAFHVLHRLWGHFLISSRFLISLLHYQGAIVHLLHILVAVRKMSQKALQWAWVYNERTVLVPRFPTFIFLKISTGQLDNRARMTSRKGTCCKVLCLPQISCDSPLLAVLWIGNPFPLCHCSLCSQLRLHFS